LLLIQEVFRQNNKNLSLEFYSQFIPVIFQKAISDKGFIKEEALKCIKILEQISYLEKMLPAISLLLADKRPVINEMGSNFLLTVASAQGFGLTFSKPDVSQLFFKILLDILEGKRMQLIKAGQQILKGLQNKLGEPELLKQASSSLSKEDFAAFEKHFKVAPEKPVLTFKEFLKSKESK